MLKVVLLLGLCLSGCGYVTKEEFLSELQKRDVYLTVLIAADQARQQKELEKLNPGAF